MRLALSLLLFALAACGPAPTTSTRAPPQAKAERAGPPQPPFRLLACVDKAGHRAVCAGDPNEPNECVAADRFGRCPGDPECFDDGGSRVSCQRPLKWVEVIVSGPEWRPTAGDIAKLEASARLPAEAQTIASYRRFYAGVTVQGRRMIKGVYLGHERPWQPLPGEAAGDGIHIRAMAQLPNIADGGCSVVTVFYDVEAGGPASSFCNGLG